MYFVAVVFFLFAFEMGRRSEPPPPVVVPWGGIAVGIVIGVMGTLGTLRLLGIL